MKVVILNAGDRLRSLASLSNVTILNRVEDKTSDDVRAFVAAQSQPFVLLWHKWLHEAVEILGDLAADWPTQIVGCALFSSAPYANGTFDAAESLRNLDVNLRERLHICSSGVSKEQVAAVVVERFRRFAGHVSPLEELSGAQLPFILLEPPPANAEIFSAQIAVMLSRKENNLQKISNCVDWERLRTDILKNENIVDVASLRRALRGCPNQMKCPLCDYRIGLKHTLEQTRVPLAVLRGEQNPISLRNLTSFDTNSRLKAALEHHIVTTQTCSRTEFVKNATAAVEALFASHCALFCNRMALLALRDRVEADTLIEDDAIGNLVDEIIEALSCDDTLVDKEYMVKLPK